MNNQPTNNRIVVIDGNSLINRAYYAIQRPMMNKDGLYTHAVYGFLNMLYKIESDYEPGYWVVAFDRKVPTFRHLEYEDYKAGRKPMPPELAMQLPVLKEILETMHIKIIEIDGFEADDIIGTVAKRAEAAGLEPLIITGDKDALQLATDNTKIILTKRGISDFDLYDAKAMQKVYGFTPQQFIDYKGLMGDPSDHIPGLPGVGDKTARKLIHQFGSIANLIENTHNISNEKLRIKIEENIQLALMSRRLAEIHTDIPIETNFDECKALSPDYHGLIEIYQKLEFNSFIKRIELDSSKLDTDKPAIRQDVTTIRIQNEEDLTKLKASLKDGEQIIALKVFSDNNHKDLPLIYAIFIATFNQNYYIQLNDNNPRNNTLFLSLKKILQEYRVKIIGHNLQMDYYALCCHDFFTGIPFTLFDTAIAQYLIQPGRSSYELKSLSLEYLHKDLTMQTKEEAEQQLGIFKTDTENYCDIGACYCQAVFELYGLMEERLQKEGLVQVFRSIEMPLIYVLATMEVNGFSVDKEELQAIRKALTQQIEQLKDKIYKLAGQEFNINSPKQLGEILFIKLKLPAGKKTKTGYSTNAEILEKLRGQHEIVDLVLEYRTISKLINTYIEGLLPLIHKDGKIHPHFQQTVAATGRISCTEPNLQNIPIRQEAGRKLRKAFIPEDDAYVLISADYSQIELRVLAHMSGDPSLIQAFNEGADIHKATASRVFGIPEDKVTMLQRSNAKAVNFGVIYGMSGFGLSSELNITRKEAETYIDQYFNKYKQVKEFMDSQIAKCKQNGYVTTIMNRKRPVPEINARNYMVRQAGERLAMNSPIQGSAADIIKLAMISCHEQLTRENRKSRLILQVHDELIIQASKDELEYVKSMLKENMEHAIELKVSLSVDINIGESWYELK